MAGSAGSQPKKGPMNNHLKVTIQVQYEDDPESGTRAILTVLAGQLSGVNVSTEATKEPLPRGGILKGGSSLLLLSPEYGKPVSGTRSTPGAEVVENKKVSQVPRLLGLDGNRELKKNALGTGCEVDEKGVVNGASRTSSGGYPDRLPGETLQQYSDRLNQMAFPGSRVRQ
jgi:hypothetical protein